MKRRQRKGVFFVWISIYISIPVLTFI